MHGDDDSIGKASPTVRLAAELALSALGKQIIASTRSAAIVSGRFGGNYLNKGDKPGPLTNPLVRQALINIRCQTE